MMNETTARQIREWVQKNKGHDKFGLAPHALKTLEEVIELCVACGANKHDIMLAVDQSLAKASAEEQPAKDDPAFYEHIKEEFADVTICNEVFRYHAQLFASDEIIRQKVKVLNQRTYQPNDAGVLYRERRPNTAE